MDEKKLNLFRKFRTGLVTFKYTLQRGYVWLQTPTLALIGAGVLKPYFPNWHFWQLALIALCAFLFVGWLDRKLKLIHEEQNMVTRMNPTLMKGLYGGLDGRRDTTN